MFSGDTFKLVRQFVLHKKYIYVHLHRFHSAIVASKYLM